MLWPRRLLCCLLIAVASAACSSDPAGPPPERQSSVAASVVACTADPAEIEALIIAVFNNAPDESAGLGKWHNIRHQVEDLNNLSVAKEKVFDLVDFIVLKRAQGAITTDDATLSELINQLFCFVGLPTNVTDPDDFWIVNVGDPVRTFMTADGLSGIQFPGNAVSENTIVYASRVDEAALITELDEYPFVYDWSLSPAQTLQNGAVATIGVCPNPASFADVPAGELQAVLDRLVLGHQTTPTVFDLLEQVPIPVEMTLDCGDTPTASLRGGAVSRVLRQLTDWILPAPAMAATLLKVGGVGGNTSEFSAFGPVDPVLRVGGVGGNTSEFSRLDATAVVAANNMFAGTVGTQRTSGLLPSLSVATRRGTPIPGTGVTFTASPPATQTPVGNASICDADTATDASGAAAVRCLDFGTTVGDPIAYTKLRATVSVPARLASTNAAGDPIVTFEPSFQTWLVESHGPSAMVVTSPPVGRTVAGSNPYTADDAIPVTVEIRSSLGELVPIATNTVGITLNQNAFGAGTVISKSAVAGTATFTAVVPTAATGYRVGANATLAAGAANALSNLFDVVAGNATLISIIGQSSYGTLAPSATPVSPSPTVLVTDAWGNNKQGASVFWTPGGATGASVSATPTTTGATGTTSTGWTLGLGSNELVAALNAAGGTPQVIFTATSATPTLQVVNSCAPGGAKDAVSDFYFTMPGDRGTISSVGLYLSLSGAVGQADPLSGYAVTLAASRVVNGVTQVFTSNATALLRGDNGASNPENKLVTFAFAIPPVGTGGNQPRLTFTFVPPATPYPRRLNFNVGPCGPGKCNPPPSCDAIEYRLPVAAANPVYRKSVAVIVRALR